MMDEFINRQEAIEQAKAKWAKLPLSETTGFGILMRVLTSIPAADVRPVVQARWQYKTMAVPGGKGQTYAKWCCTACKGKAKERTNFCPNCGADMREES